MSPTTAALSLEEALRAARDTRCLEIGEGALAATPRIFREQFGGRPAVVVADANTHFAAGHAVQEAFQAAHHSVLDPFIFQSLNLFADYGQVEKLEASLHQHEAIPLAVGSGTINDLTKLAAHQAKRPYMCVATAASMDGYTAFGASITRKGFKQTFPCPAPAAVVADLGVIAAAPPEMNAWGYADLLAKRTAGADWILADALGVEPIDTQAWNIVQGRLRDAVADPPGVRARHPETLRRLVEGLMLGGLAMQSVRSSRPASGAEHQFSHLWDTQRHTHQGRAPSHGLKVGIGTLAVTAFYECLLRRPLEELDVERCVAVWPDAAEWSRRARGLFGETAAGALAVQEIAAKHISRDDLRRQLERLRAVWPQLTIRLRQQLIPFSVLREMLRTVGAATDPVQIGISVDRLRDSFWQAFFIRRRFTVLDLAARAGVLDACVDEVFGPGGRWPLESQNPIQARS